MQNKIITLAVATALTAPAVSFAADKKNDGTPTLYGKAHLSYGLLEER